MVRTDLVFFDTWHKTAFDTSIIHRCWITMDRPILRLTMYYIPLIIMWIFTIVLYITVMKQVSRLLSFLWKRTAFRLSLFLLVSIVSNMPGTLLLLYQINTFVLTKFHPRIPSSFDHLLNLTMALTLTR